MIPPSAKSIAVLSLLPLAEKFRINLDQQFVPLLITAVGNPPLISTDYSGPTGRGGTPDRSGA